MEPGQAHIETLDTGRRDVPFDFGMLLPPFTGVGLTALGRTGEDITPKLFAPNGFMKVDANYEKKPYEQWSPKDWPQNYQSPAHSNMFAAGMAFAPPHPISRPRTTAAGIVISPAPPRTGMPSAIIGKTVARSIVDMMGGRQGHPYSLVGRDGSRLRCFRRRESFQRDCGLHHGLSHYSRLRALPIVWT